MTPALSVIGLTKRYKEFVLGPLDFQIEPGLVIGLIGPNGAGKSTTINMMAGLIKPESGHTEICGKVVDQSHPDWKYDLGYIGDDPVFYERWSGAKNLKFVAQFFPDWSDRRAMELAKRFDLDLNKKASQLSKGNRAKLYLISVLARQPKVMLFDEPTAGLDPVVRSEVLDVIWEQMESGQQSVLYSTHILSDINKIADELVFLIDGKMTLRCAKDDLIERWRKVTFMSPVRSLKLSGVMNHKIEGDRHLLVSSDYEVLGRQLTDQGIHDAEMTRLTIDEIAVNIMKGGNHVADY